MSTSTATLVPTLDSFYPDRKLFREYEPHHFSAEASEIGLRAGQWPKQIVTKIGNGRPFLRTSKKVDEIGDLRWVTYVQEFGCCRIRVYND